MFELVQALSPEEAQIQVAWITGGVAIVVAVFSFFGARRLTRPKPPKEDPDATAGVADVVLSSYTGEQNEFVSMVIQNSLTVQHRLDHLDAIVEEMRKERTQVMGAFARYVNKLAKAWGSGGSMPYPDTEDLKILEETLPADWRRRPK
jgi:hypothetical protein